MRVTVPVALLLTALIGGASLTARAAPPQADPDWPCHQRLVPELTGATYWNGPALPDHADWRHDKAVAAVVLAVSPRDVPTEEGEKTLAAFADKVPKARRAAVYPKAFAAIVEEVNRQRGDVIARLKSLAHRQREVGDLVSQATNELQAIPADVTDPDKRQQRAEIVQRRDYLIRSFEEVERTLRYTCEVPVDLEARLGSYARVLGDRLAP